MIIKIFPNVSPGELTGNTIKQLGKSLPVVTPESISAICICNYIKCKYKEPVFASNTNDFWKNDKSDFLFKRLLLADTVDIYLYRGGKKVALLDNNNYGAYFDGFTGSDQQQLYKGFLVDWKKVLQIEGVGNYEVRADLVVAGVATEFISREFELKGYSDLLANGTVRIEAYQNGNIFGGNFDYTGNNWYSSVRIPGIFGNPTPEYLDDNYISGSREKKQISATMSRKWTLATKLLPWQVAEKLVYNQMLANKILITDYNIFAESIWRRLDVRLSEISKPVFKSNPNKSYTFTMLDTKNIFEKRNY